MKKVLAKYKKSIIIVAIVTIICITFSIYLYQNRSMSTKEVNELWSIYEQNFEGMRKNMDEISISDDNFRWSKLKDFDIKDKAYVKFLNLVTRAINEWNYFYSPDSENITEYSFIFYGDKDSIKVKDFEIIQKNELGNLLSSDLKIWNSYFVSMASDGENFDRAKEKVNELLEIYEIPLFTEEEPTYEEIVLRYVLESNRMYHFTEWLKQEYYRLK